MHYTYLNSSQLLSENANERTEEGREGDWRGAERARENCTRASERSHSHSSSWLPLSTSKPFDAGGRARVRGRSRRRRRLAATSGGAPSRLARRDANAARAHTHRQSPVAHTHARYTHTRTRSLRPRSHCEPEFLPSRRLLAAFSSEHSHKDTLHILVRTHHRLASVLRCPHQS